MGSFKGLDKDDIGEGLHEFRELAKDLVLYCAKKFDIFLNCELTVGEYWTLLVRLSNLG